MKTQILLVEDNERLGYVLREYLSMKGFEVSWASDGQQGLELFQQHSFHLCILDVMMPGMDGYTLAEKIKAAEPAMPLVFLTARSLKVDVLKGFNLGADDYVKKPVDEEELLARINAVLKRATPGKAAEPSDTIRIGKYLFDAKNQQLTIGDKSQLLTKKEAEVLHFLCLHMDELAPRTKMLQAIWGKSDFFTRKSMDVFISKLRKHLAEDEQVQIVNVHGSGFILRVDRG
ncbi:MAG: response regulator transcription factor [Phaeodactylibacter sp.]|nr:response regulator transcription factor [Phaeodactylibacter sp.]MCB9272642.1 response regulator transcription factor [Lewinellaceae bacterium]